MKGVNLRNLSIQWQILLPIAGVSLIGGVVLFFFFSSLYKEQAIESLATKARAVILSAESAREFAAEQGKHNVFRQDLTTKEEILRTVPIFAAMKVAKKKANELGFTLKIPKESPRNPDNEPDEYERSILNILNRKEISETWAIDEQTKQLRFFRPVELTSECMKCHGDPAKSMEYWGRNDGKDITGTAMEGWKTGEIHGAFEVLMPMAPVEAAVSQKALGIAGISFGITLIIILIGWYVAVRIKRPLQRLEVAADRLAGGDFESTIKVESQDEVGRLSRAFNEMNGKLLQRNNEQNAYLNNSVEEILESMQKFSNGDLTVEVVPKKDDAIGNLFRGFNEAVNKIRAALQHIMQLTDKAKAETEQIASNSRQIASGSLTQAHQSGELAAAVEEMAATIMDTTRNTTVSAESARTISNNAKQGSSILGETQKSMVQITTAVGTNGKMIDQLVANMVQVGDIARTIEDIADQTNLLALNAAIEAARAGEHGKGFAVVADEVRKLADRTRNATTEIGRSIQTIQKESKDVVQSMESSLGAVEKGSGMMEQVVSVFDRITMDIHGLSDLINQVAAASEEQSAVTEQISQTINGISSVANEHAVGSEGLTRSVEELRALNENLVDQIQTFNLGYESDYSENEKYLPQPKVRGFRDEISRSGDKKLQSTSHSRNLQLLSAKK